MGSEMDRIADRLARTNGHGQGLRHLTAEAYLANLSDDNLILTALLPSDATAHRNLVLGILDQDDLTRLDSTFPLQSMNRERILRPGEVAQVTLRKPPTANHISLFRVRKEKTADSLFVKYQVEVEGPTPGGTLTQLGPRSPSGRLENRYPHLLCLW